jgi:hypothetical protein
MNEKEKVLDAMRKAGEPVNAGKIVELTGLDRKIVDKVMADLKKEDLLFLLFAVNGNQQINSVVLWQVK